MKRLCCAFLTGFLFFSGYMEAQKSGRKFMIKEDIYEYCVLCNRGDTHTELISNKKSKEVDFHNSHVLFFEENYPEAQKLLISLLDPESNRAEAFFVNYMLGDIYKSSSLPAKSIDAFKSSLASGHPVSDSLKNRIILAIGHLQFKQKKLREALESYEMVENSPSVASDLSLQKALYNNKALLFLYDKKYTDAEAYHFKEIAIDKELKDTVSLAISYMNLGNLYYEQYLDDKAIPLFKKSLELAKTTDNLELKQNSFLNMAVVSEDARDYPNALFYRKNYERLKDSIYNRDKVWELAEQEKQFAISKKQDELDLQKADLKISRLQSNIFLGFAIVFLGLGFAAFMAYRYRIRKNRLIDTQRRELADLNKMKDRLFSIVAHDLRSPVYSMKEMNLRFENAFKLGDKSAMSNLIQSKKKITDDVYRLLDNLLHWALQQTKQLHFKKEKLHLRSIIRQIAFDFNEIAEQKGISIDIKIPGNLFVHADTNSLKIAIRNLLDNAIKFTPVNGWVKIKSTQFKEGDCRIIIEDSGMGIDSLALKQIREMKEGYRQQDTSGKTSTGIGLWLSRVMIEKNNGKLNIRSKKGMGTRVTIELSNSTNT
ncbi:tetratricopeptide repeat-containing sensor histidine kinase [Leptobacterium flavescens]|nr:tetratricopeptide repeat-containing sensor histidine kinase [Leptobacterium flavescens]